MSFEIGARVETEKGRGIVQYYGETEFADGMWVGVSLYEPNGKNNGTVKGVKYFECEPLHGVFLRATQVRHESRLKPTGTRLSARQSTALRGKVSPAASPVITPSSAVEKLKSVGGSGGRNLGKRASSGIRSNVSSREELDSTSQLGDEQPTPKSNIGTPGRQRVGSLKKSNESALQPAEDSFDNQEAIGGVKNIVKRMEESMTTLPAYVPPSNLGESSELEWLRIQNKDLTEKLESLRIKRREDHLKLIEYEKNKVQLQTLQEFKIKIMEDHTRLQRQLQEKEREIRESLESKHDEREDMSEVESRLELIAIEKEMAEEKAEMLQTELDAAKEHVQELETELEALRDEMEQAGGGPLEGNSVQMKQLQQQNEKLREAVIRMRDHLGQVGIEKQKAVEELEASKDEMMSLTRYCEKMKKDLELGEQTIYDLREQVDVAMGSEKIIETLTEKNLMLEEKLRGLEDTIEDLEALRTMDEEMLDTQRESEKDLRNELDSAQCRIRELQLQIIACDEQAQDYEKTISMFRKKVVDLNEEIQDHQDQILRLEEETKKLTGDFTQEDRVYNPVMATRTFAESVDARIHALELEYARQMVSYLKIFLPDSFMKPGGDNDAVTLSVLYPRFSQKIALLMQLLNEKYPTVPGGMRREHVTKSHKAEQWAHCAKFEFLLNSLGTVVHKFGSAIKHCSVERLSRLAHLQMEMVAQECIVDQYIDLMKSSRLDENTSTENLEKTISTLQNIYSVQMASEKYDMKQTLLDTIAQFFSGLNWLKTNAQRIIFFLQPDIENSGIRKFAKHLTELTADCEQLSLRSKNRVPTQKEIMITQKIEGKLHDAMKNLRQVANIVNNCCALASIQLSTLTDVDSLEDGRLKELLQGAVEKIYGPVDVEKAQAVIADSMQALKQMLVELSTELDSGTLEMEKVDKKEYPPLLERAHARTQDAAEAEGLRWQLEKKENEIVDLKKALRSRTDEIGNYKLRLELLNKKSLTLDRDEGVRVVRLQKRCDELENELKKKKDEYEETMDALQHDLEVMEKENAVLKERAKNMSKKALFMNLSNNFKQQISSPQGSSSSSTTEGGSGRLQISKISALEDELCNVRDALRFAYHTIRQLKGKEVLRLVADMRQISVTGHVAGPVTLRGIQGPNKEEVDKLLRAAENSACDARRYQLPYVADFTRSKNRQRSDGRVHQNNIKALNRSISDLKEKVVLLCARQNRNNEAAKLIEGSQKILHHPSKIDGKVEEGIHSASFKLAFQQVFGSLQAEQKELHAKYGP